VLDDPGLDGDVRDAVADSTQVGDAEDTSSQEDNIEPSDSEGNDTQGTDVLNSDSGPVDAVLSDAALSDSEGADTDQVAADSGMSLDSVDGSVSEDATSEDVGASSDTVTDDDTFEPPQLPSAPSPIALQVVSPSSVDVELDEPAVFLSRLGESGRLIQTATAVHVLQGLVYAEAAVPEGQLQGATPHGPWTILGADLGLWVIDEGFFFESPIVELLASPDVRFVASTTPDTGDGGLWIGQSEGVFFWESEVLFQVTLPDWTWDEPRLSYGALFDGMPTLWVADQARVMALVPTGDDYEAVTVLEGYPVSAIGSDALGNLWLLSEGTLIRRDPMGTFSWWSHDELFLDLVSDPQSQEIWLRANSGWIWLKDDAFSAVESTGSLDLAAWVGDGQLLASDAEQTVLVAIDESAAVLSPTWQDDIQPLFADKCSLCHSADNIASNLSTSAAWQESITDILLRVTVDMPANDPPLAPAFVALIQSWQEGGFLP
jgi:hypothetical protein